MQLKALTLAALASTAFCQGEQDLVSTLRGLPQLSNLTSYLSAFPNFNAQLSQLSNITLLAPNNRAFAQLLNSSAGAALTNGDQALIQALFSYHVLNGTYSSFNATQFVPTALHPPQFTIVTGGQVVEAHPENNTVSFFSGLLRNANVTGQPVNFTGGVVHVIDRVLTIPQNISATAVELNLTSAAGALTQAKLIETLDYLSDVTVFVPNNDAFQAIGSALPNLTTEQVTSILTYHVVNGTVGYSTMLSNTSLVTVQGTNVTISVIGNEVFVNSAQVVVPNVLVANGVMHVINGVLNPENSTATAQSRCFNASSGLPWCIERKQCALHQRCASAHIHGSVWCHAVCHSHELGCRRPDEDQCGWRRCDLRWCSHRLEHVRPSRQKQSKNEILVESFWKPP